MRHFLLFLSIVTFSLDVSSQDEFAQDLSNAAVELTANNITYDPGYFKIDYPNGDIPANRGVCTDVIIRAYRKLGIDLQKEVHEDMASNFEKYPAYWGLKSPDTNIDHRRVPNLMTFFSRHGEIRRITSNPEDYEAGDIVTWDLGRGIPHIGIVISKRSADNKRSLIVHNIGRGQEISDCLFSYKITGHYRYKK